MKVACIFILAATAAALTVDTRLPAKPFHPIIQNKGTFTVHEKPATLATSAGVFSNIIEYVDTYILGNVNYISAAAVTYLSNEHDIPAANIRVTSAYTDSASGITHVFVVQTVNGRDITNAVANVNISSDRKVISSSHSFASKSALTELEKNPGISLQDDVLETAKQSLLVLADFLGSLVSKASIGDIVASLITDEITSIKHVLLEALPESLAISGTATANQVYIQLEDGTITPTWLMNVEQKESWWNAHVDPKSKKVVALNNWYANSESYNVYPKEVRTPDDGSRSMVVDPANSNASPNGWVTEGSTYGNNVWAQDNPTGGNDWKNNHRPKAQEGNVFDYPLDLTLQPVDYVDAAITQLFYTNNIMHDLSYIYGFDEAAGNFQDSNSGCNGLGNDAVIANAQDGSGTNNANFATPPDGQHPRMRMYIWTETTPNRDGDLEQDIVVHEYTHGISNRLTGGPANSNCLSTGESGGMGEGWSDAMANILRLKSTDTKDSDFILGDYVYTKNIRNYPYSTSMNTNPSTYKFLDRPDYQEVHAIGEVWAEMLYEVMWALIEKNGFAEDIFAHDLTKGNSIMLQIMLDGMKLQPCTPTFIDARDAIIQAENNLTGGKNKCEIWTAFAKRGLGAKASGKDGGPHTEDYSVPSGC